MPSPTGSASGASGALTAAIRTVPAASRARSVPSSGVAADERSCSSRASRPADPVDVPLCWKLTEMAAWAAAMSARSAASSIRAVAGVPTGSPSSMRIGQRSTVAPAERTTSTRPGAISSTHSRACGTPSSCCRESTARTSSTVAVVVSPSRGRAQYGHPELATNSVNGPISSSRERSLGAES